MREFSRADPVQAFMGYGAIPAYGLYQHNGLYQVCRVQHVPLFALFFFFYGLYQV